MFCPVCRSEYADDWKVCPKDAAVLLRSQYVGKYRIDQLLGAGGMGAVYKAYNPDTQSTVAVKLMHGGATANDASRQRFQREAASIAALRTRHVVSIYDFGADDDGTLYLVMEYLQGHPLRSEVAAMPHCIPLTRVNFLVDQSLRGLGPAHRAGIVHRDLKPENLFVADTDDGEVVKILDFGIARVQRGDTPNLTHSGALMGTPAYMAPEQVAGNRGQVGRHSDVYAFGVIIYEMLTGMSPFHAETISEVLSKILSREFAPLAQLRPDLPPALSQLVDRALSDDPAARFGAADDMREAWGRAWSQLPADIRNAPIPPYTSKDGGGPVESAPGIGRNTDVPSAPTQFPARLMGTTPATPPALAATAAADSQQIQFPSVTPGPVVVDTQHVKRGKGGLIALIAAVAVAGGIAAVVVLGSGNGSGTGTGTGTGTSAVIVVDAKAKPTITIDAAVAVVKPPIDAAPPPAIDAGPSDMVQFPGATFDMGDDPADAAKFPGAQAKHPVTVAPFALDKTEMADDSGMPLTGLSWDDADAACRALGKRLPTEAEWELASKASEIDPRHANLKEAKKKGPTKVGTMSGDCTDEGICDLLGNVMEWTADKVVRGASYTTAAGGWYGTVHARLVTDGSGDKEIGFRCAK